MRKYIVVVGVIVALVIGINSHAGNYERENVINSVFQVEWVGPFGVETGGNAFVICDQDGLPSVAVTAYHVATDVSWQPLTMLQAKQYGVPIGQIEVFYHDTQTDIALLRVPSRIKTCIPFADIVTENITFFSALTTALDEYTLVWSLPYWGLEGQFTSCCQNLNALVQDVIGPRWSNMALANVLFSSGVSGSPVVYSNYKLAGVAVGMWTRTNGAIIVPVSELKAALERAQAGAAAPPGMTTSKKKFQHATPFALPTVTLAL